MAARSPRVTSARPAGSRTHNPGGSVVATRSRTTHGSGAVFENEDARDWTFGPRAKRCCAVGSDTATGSPDHPLGAEVARRGVPRSCSRPVPLCPRARQPPAGLRPVRHSISDSGTSASSSRGTGPSPRSVVCANRDRSGRSPRRQPARCLNLWRTLPCRSPSTHASGSATAGSNPALTGSVDFDRSASRQPSKKSSRALSARGFGRDSAEIAAATPTAIPNDRECGAAGSDVRTRETCYAQSPMRHDPRTSGASTTRPSARAHDSVRASSGQRRIVRHHHNRPGARPQARAEARTRRGRSPCRGCRSVRPRERGVGSVTMAVRPRPAAARRRTSPPVRARCARSSPTRSSAERACRALPRSEHPRASAAGLHFLPRSRCRGGGND